MGLVGLGLPDFHDHQEHLDNLGNQIGLEAQGNLWRHPRAVHVKHIYCAHHFKFELHLKYQKTGTDCLLSSSGYVVDSSAQKFSTANSKVNIVAVYNFVHVTLYWKSPGPPCLPGSPGIPGCPGCPDLPGGPWSPGSPGLPKGA